MVGENDAAAEDREPHFLAGRRLVTQQDYDGAEKSFYKALEANPRSAAANYELGVLFLSRKNDPASAIFHLQRYLILKPEAENKKDVLGQIEGLKSDLAGEILGNPQSQPNRSIQALRTQLNHLAAENAALKHQLLSKGITPQSGGYNKLYNHTTATAATRRRQHGSQPAATHGDAHAHREARRQPHQHRAPLRHFPFQTARGQSRPQAGADADRR